jgi:hypothetical protein
MEWVDLQPVPKGIATMGKIAPRLLETIRQSNKIKAHEGGTVKEVFVNGGMVERYTPLFDVDNDSGGYVVTATVRGYVKGVLVFPGMIIEEGATVAYILPKPKPPKTHIIRFAPEPVKAIYYDKLVLPPEPKPKPIIPAPEPPVIVELIERVPDLRLLGLGVVKDKERGTRTYSTITAIETGITALVKELNGRLPKGTKATNDSELLQAGAMLLLSLTPSQQIDLLEGFRELLPHILPGSGKSQKPQKPLTNERLQSGLSLTDNGTPTP